MSDIKRFPFPEPIAIYLHSSLKLRAKAFSSKEAATTEAIIGASRGFNAKAQNPNVK
jgi:hypothetical protein